MTDSYETFAKFKKDTEDSMIYGGPALAMPTIGIISSIDYLVLSSQINTGFADGKVSPETKAFEDEYGALPDLVSPSGHFPLVVWTAEPLALETIAAARTIPNAAVYPIQGASIDGCPEAAHYLVQLRYDDVNTPQLQWKRVNYVLEGISQLQDGIVGEEVSKVTNSMLKIK